MILHFGERSTGLHRLLSFVFSQKQNIWVLALIATVWGAPFVHGTKPDSEVKEELSDVLKNKYLKGAGVGVLIKSLDKGETLYSKNADKLLNPASNVKLITTLAALHILKPEFRFRTEYYLYNKSLYVKGYGDPSITTQRLRRVARQLRLRGIVSVSNDLILDETFFDRKMYAKGFRRKEDRTRAYAAPTSAVALNKNAFEVFLRATKAGKPSFCSIEPQSDYFLKEGRVKTVRRGYSPRISVETQKDKLAVHLSGVMGKKAGIKSFWRRVEHPTYYFGETFRQLLAAEGIKVAGKVKRARVPHGAKLIYTDYSPRLAYLVNETNKYSSNFMAEMLVKAISATRTLPASFKSGLALIRRFLEEEVGLKPKSYVLGNGSGLNNVNKFTAGQIIKILEYATNEFELASEFIASLSVAGAQGTLTKRLKEPSVLRQLRAKTGTLTGVSSLSGYMRGDGDDVLAFAIIFDGHHSSAWRMTRIQDEMSRKLAKIIMSSHEKDVLSSKSTSSKAVKNGG